jgi:hypothetical protein
MSYHSFHMYCIWLVDILLGIFCVYTMTDTILYFSVIAFLGFSKTILLVWSIDLESYLSFLFVWKGLYAINIIS